MAYPDIRLIALDLDGTLLDEAQEIPIQTVETIQEVKQRGVIVTLASARPLCSVLPYADRLGITAPLITNGGAYLVDRDQAKVLLSKPLDLGTFREMARFFEERDYYIKAYSNERLFVQEATRETIEYSSRFGVPYTEVGKKKLSALEEPPLRVFVWDDPLAGNDALELMQQWSASFAFARETGCGLEVVDRTVSKGAALKAICREFGVPLSHVMAIGNEGHDIAMVQAAGLGIAMGNACEELKRCANEVTKSNSECGVEHAIRKYVLK